MLFHKIVFFLAVTLVPKSRCESNIASELLERYNDVSTECFDSHNQAQPLYQCSGIIIRGVHNNKKFPWSLGTDDSFSFGFLRKDLRFLRLGNGYDAGFILYPHLLTPSQKNTQQVLCAFPINGFTNGRQDRGCGQFEYDPEGKSRPCDVQNITTYPQWLKHYNEIANDPYLDLSYRQCGFDMTKETAARNFDVFRKAQLHLQTIQGLPYDNNELRLEAWDENKVEQIPIQAFFYFIDSANGLKNSVKFQYDFYRESGGEKVPIVGIRMPTMENPNLVVKEELKNV